MVYFFAVIFLDCEHTLRGQLNVPRFQRLGKAGNLYQKGNYCTTHLVSIETVPVRMSLSESFKVVLLGDARVGKTSIMVRYTRNTYSDQQPSSKPPRPEGPCATKKLRVASTLVQLSLWDTAGQEEYHALAPMYYRDASSAVLVYDITDTDSYNKVKKWVKELRKVVDDNIPIAIVGNKIDLERNRHVNAKEAAA